MPRNVSVAKENEEVWFPHPADPANLFFQVRVKDGALTVIGAHNAYGPSNLTENRQSANAVVLTMPDPPSRRKIDPQIAGLTAAESKQLAAGLARFTEVWLSLRSVKVNPDTHPSLYPHPFMPSIQGETGKVTCYLCMGRPDDPRHMENPDV